ncbi:hypothetical protein C7974DRAFT_420559 [Boeremia exigua]|uniref:uncharacterized protein n=1 Tax=Boeremia exigua TaxID=749465 RepID=UPI001E8D6194|nr:uncharacterized protein C7974DRAFT_420559 [Boeremia exigua]KAH6642250.1 hypothetical protein C7974DRAFT_420559 [Boeremia exigua]
MSKNISCTATSVQLGYKRFPDRHERPRIKAWRCDLTALSRSHNFYFVACNDTIRVYQPKFPDQSIPGDPALILHPPISAPGLTPGIDHEDSHSITRLHVDYLGQDEIILITCDDGDVIGYRTEEIQRVLDKHREAPDDEDEFDIEEPVRTFLHRNVGASAWGLAIHQEARMIAISANTEKVTVIAYALAQPMDYSDDEDASSDSGLSNCSDEEESKDFPQPRRQDHIITLSARHNVPSVSFNNSGDDPSGRWLSSCSINGEALIWDLHNPEQAVRTIRLGFCASVRDPTKAPKLNPGTCACLRPSMVPHAVWDTMFLDVDIAFEDPSLQFPALPVDHPFPHIRDVSECKSRFAVKPRKHPHMGIPTIEASSDDEFSNMNISEAGSVISDDEGSQLSSSTGSTDSEYVDSIEEAVMELDATGDPVDDQLSQEPVESSEDTLDSSANIGTVSHGAPSTQVAVAQEPVNAINPFGAWFQPLNQNTTTIVWDDDESDSDDGLFVPSTTHIHIAFANAIQPARAYCEIGTAFTLARQPKITSPLLIVTKEDVHLYQRPLDYIGDKSDPIITIRQPLHPDKRENAFPFIPGSHDRHCYTTQIPELGIFIVASPNGRAGIFSLTKSAKKNAGPANSKIWDVEGARLIGVAAGPVQGMLDRPDRFSNENEHIFEDAGKPGMRRWRLMMYFTDHTVLAFEVAKQRDGAMPGVGELVV